MAGHPSLKAPLVEFATGSLGHGLSLGIEVALADRLDGLGSKTVVLMGDGELQEGPVWEAALCAPRFGLTNLLAIVDRNGFQASAAVDDVLPLDPLEEKWRSFRWNTQVIDGRDMEAILGALERFPERFFDVGISEANLIGVAVGLAHAGKLPFVVAMAPFVSMRSFEQIRTDCGYNRNNVKIIAPVPVWRADTGEPPITRSRISGCSG